MLSDDFLTADEARKSLAPARRGELDWAASAPGSEDGDSVAEALAVDGIDLCVIYGPEYDMWFEGIDPEIALQNLARVLKEELPALQNPQNLSEQ